MIPPPREKGPAAALSVADGTGRAVVGMEVEVGKASCVDDDDDDDDAELTVEDPLCVSVGRSVNERWDEESVVDEDIPELDMEELSLVAVEAVVDLNASSVAGLRSVVCVD